MSLFYGRPLWTDAEHAREIYTEIKQSVECDVLVIGAGISGALAAYLLTKHGYHVIVTDKSYAANGSSMASTGILQYETDLLLSELSTVTGQKSAEQWYLDGFEAINLLEKIHGETGSPAEFIRQPSIYLSVKGDDKKELADELQRRNAIGLACEWLEEKELEDLGLNGKYGILNHSSAITNAFSFTLALLNNISNHNGKVYTQSAVTGIIKNNDNIKCVINRDKDRCITSRFVVNASGYNVPGFLDLESSKSSLTYTIAGKTTGEPSFKGIIWTSGRPYNYLRFENDMAIIGGCDENILLQEGLSNLERRSEELSNSFRNIFRGNNIITDYSWVSMFKTGWSSLPRFGWIDSTENIYAIQAYGGNGIVFSTLAALDLLKKINYKTRPNRSGMDIL